MHILIPAGGRGTRLRPLTWYCPKPLLPLAGRPILSRIVQGLPPEARVTVIVTPQLEAEFQEWSCDLQECAQVRICVEPATSGEPGGPVTALATCIHQLGITDDVLVLMGDSVLPFTVAEFLASRTESVRIAAYELASLRDASRFGVVEFDAGSRLVSFQEKPEYPRSRWVFTGCLYLPARLVQAFLALPVDRWKQLGDLVAGYLEMGEAVEVFRAGGEWHDIGCFASYIAAHRSFQSDSRRGALLAASNELAGTVYVHPSAIVAGSKIANCVISADAVVLNADLADCVIHPEVSVIERVVRGKLVTAEAELPVYGDT